MNMVEVHFVDVLLPDGTERMCFMEPKAIAFYRLKGMKIFDYTISLDMEPELIDKGSCYVPETSDTTDFASTR